MHFSDIKTVSDYLTLYNRETGSLRGFGASSDKFVKLQRNCSPYISIKVRYPVFCKSISYRKNMALSDCQNFFIINAIPPFSDLSMECSMKLHTIKSGWSILYIEGSQAIISKKNCISFSGD